MQAHPPNPAPLPPPPLFPRRRESIPSGPQPLSSRMRGPIPLLPHVIPSPSKNLVAPTTPLAQTLAIPRRGGSRTTLPPLQPINTSPVEAGLKPALRLPYPQTPAIPRRGVPRGRPSYSPHITPLPPQECHSHPHPLFPQRREPITPSPTPAIPRRGGSRTTLPPLQPINTSPGRGVPCGHLPHPPFRSPRRICPPNARHPS